MVERIQDALLLGSTAMMHVGGIISGAILGYLFHSSTISLIVFAALVIIDILILFRCVQTVANKKTDNKKTEDDEFP